MPMITEEDILLYKLGKPLVMARHEIVKNFALLYKHELMYIDAVQHYVFLGEDRVRLHISSNMDLQLTDKRERGLIKGDTFNIRLSTPDFYDLALNLENVTIYE